MSTIKSIKVTLLTAFALWANGTSAATFCVGTVSELASALDYYDTGAQSDEVVTIRVRQGTYSAGNALTRLFGANAADGVSLKLLGGYTANCASRQPDPRNTTIDAGNAFGSGVGIMLKGKGAATIEALTFTRFDGATSFVSTDGVKMSRGEVLLVTRDFSGDGDETFCELRQNRFVRNRGNSVVSLWAAQMRFVNNLVADNALVPAIGTQSDGAAMFTLESDTDAQVTATNNTIVDNTLGPGMLINGRADSGGSGESDRLSEIVDNIVWNNPTDIVFVKPSGYVYPLVASHNLYRSASVGFPQSPSTDVRTDPRFDDALVATYRLASNSPAINRGSFIQLQGFPPRDAEGKARIVGSRVDIGAYESPIDDATTAIVTNTGDNGSNASPTPGSLRAALKAASAASGPFSIRFNMAAACPAIVSLAAPLPDVTGDVTIDGTTQPGWSPTLLFSQFNGRHCVFLNGLGKPWALHVPPTAPSTARLVVRGMVFSGFSDAAIKLEGGRNHRISGSQFGLVPLTVPNRNAIRVTGNSGGAFIGGYDDPAEQNFIAGSSAEGILLDNAAGGSTLANNVIGFQADGYGYAGNATGVAILNAKNNLLQRNSIGQSTGSGVLLSGAASTGNLLQDNGIGVGTNHGSPNTGAGVLVNFGAHHNTIGSPLDASWGGNYFVADTSPGVWISPSGGTGNSVLGNRVYGKGLDIDIGQAGPSANVPVNPASGPNNLQNWPVLASLTYDAAHGISYLAGTLNGAVKTAYRIDVYYSYGCSAGAPGRGAAQVSLAHTQITTGPLGVTPFTIGVPDGPVGPGGFLSATATDPDGNTSEIGNCVAPTP
jgi:hypothetical protein